MLFMVSSKKRSVRSLTAWSGYLVMLITFAGCAAAPPPPPPDTSSVSTSSNVKKKPDAKEKDELDTDSTSNSSSNATTAAYLGANVGDDDTKKAATECIKTKKFFDRAGAPPGKCSAFKLADFECTVESIKTSISGEDAKNTFTTMMAGESYSGFLIDQCIDCNGSSDEFCKKDGTGIKGMKILFVKEEPEVFKLKYMIKQ